jgi:hypothetical protein
VHYPDEFERLQLVLEVWGSVDARG